MRLLGLAGVLVVVAFAVSAMAEELPRVLDERLQLDLFAENPQIVTPVSVAIDGRGRLFVIESNTHFRPADYQGPPADRIRIFEDTDGDGRADRIETFYEGSQKTMGLAFDRDGALYVSTRREVFRLRDTDGDGKADERTDVVRLESTADYPHNALGGLAFDFNGDLLIGMGENSGAAYKLVGSDDTTLAGGGEGGNIYRCLPDGSKLRRVATGFWNPFSICFDAFDRMFAVDNDPDSRPPCRLLQVVDGGDYGFRFRNGRKGIHPFTSWNGELPGTLPMAAGTGEAPCAVRAYESDGLPEEYRGQLLVTSWGDHRIESYRLTPNGASVRAKMTPVVVGGENFRPVGLAVAPDGSLYFSDWVDKSYDLHGKGRLWHLRPKEKPSLSRPSEPAQAVQSADAATRAAAARQLVQTEEGREKLRALVATDGDPRIAATALKALAAAGDSKVDFAKVASGSKSTELRALAVRIAPAGRLDFLEFADGAQPAEVRAEALRRTSDPNVISLAMAALNENDPFLQQAAREALKRLGNELFFLGTAHMSTPQQRLGWLLAMREADEQRGREKLGRLLSDPNSAVRRAAVQWVGEERVKEMRPQVEAMLGDPNTNRELLEACLASLAFLDEKKGETAGQDSIARLLENQENQKLSETMLIAGLRALGENHPVLTIARLDGWFQNGSPELRLEIIRALRASTLSERLARLAAWAGDSELPTRSRAEAIVGLAGEESQRALLLRLAAADDAAIRHEALRSLRGIALSNGEEVKLEKTPQIANDPESMLLFEAVKPAARRTAGKRGDKDVAGWLKRLEGEGDVEAGERIFFHPKGPGCFRCHEIDGRGGHLGPELTVVGQTLTKPRLVESVVDPNREVAPQFTAWSIQLSDGQVRIGTLVDRLLGEGREAYADSQGQIFTVAEADIEAKKSLRTSIMPENLPGQMTLQEFRDLVAFLESRRAADAP